MKLLTSVVALAAMASTTLACHCRTGSGGYDMDTTKVCCMRTGVSMLKHTCPNGALNQDYGMKMDAFRACCFEADLHVTCDY
ncbi:hypothetical protein E4U31_001314 [Claviceps sp. LM219 group G6]|nr:hypothetical protein E4U15_005606 [Claviceps sp. LM218 group G6]KAG6105551.1 hypothetical protein E4U31_001314 [Claviceps sp. LM219 group G6]